MKIYHNPRCKKSRETLNIIRDSGVEPEIIEYLKTPPDKQTLKKLVAGLGIRPQDLVRRQEDVYKQNYKGKDLSDEQWLDALVTHPKLIERPIVVKDGKVVLGRPPENVKSLL